MWNSEKPLKFLMTLPDKLGKESLKRLQSIIDEDRLKINEETGRDVCGEYAPFCKYCDKNILYPCANAYVKMQQADGLCVEVSQTAYDSLKIKDDDESAGEQEPKRIRIAVARKRYVD